MSRWEKVKLVLWIVTLGIAIYIWRDIRKDTKALVENSEKLLKKSDTVLERMDHPLQGFLGGGREKK